MMDKSLDEIIREKKEKDSDQSQKSGNRSYGKDVNKSLDEIIKERKLNGQNAAKRKVKFEENGNASNDEDCTLELASDAETVFARRKKKFKMGEDENESENKNGTTEDDPEFMSWKCGYYLSPLEVLNGLSQNGLVVVQRVGRDKGDEEGTSSGERAHRWRAIFSYQNKSVTVDAPLKLLAREAAALQMLRILKNEKPEVQIPARCKIPDACYYDNVILTKLDEMCVSMGFGEPAFVTIEERVNGHPFYITKYFINEDEFIGSAFKEDHSRVLAAVSAYESFNGKKWHKERYYIGDDVSEKDDKGYNFREMEATHIHNIKMPVPTKKPNSLPELLRCLEHSGLMEEDEVDLDKNWGF